MENEVPQTDERIGVNVIDHILIRDVDSAEVLVKQRGSAKNPLDEQNED